MVATSPHLMAAAYKIPEQSINSTALAGAYVANAHGADASYYNPAAMVYNEEGAMMEGALTFIHLSSIDYQGTDFLGRGFSDSTKKENFVIPQFHYVSPAVGNARFGLSLTAPAGLSKRWEGVGRAPSQEFTLETYEINPTIGYKFNDRFSMGGGVRAVYSKARVENSPDAYDRFPIGRTAKGDSWDFGYNLALHFRATEALNLSATYRSKIDLDLEGPATLFHRSRNPLFTYVGDTSVSAPIPATLALAAAYTFKKRTTVEFTYERVYWSAYDYLDFDYSPPLNPSNPVFPGYSMFFEQPQLKDWEDSNTFRLGVTHQLNPKWILMGGFTYDKTPVPKRTAGFELPDSDAKIFSFGARYNYSDALSIGGAFLYDRKDSLNLAPGDNGSSQLAGGAEFSNARAYLLTMGLEYKF
ncbi:MAG: hypothetical protein GY703_17935 [Gammaproteobacteria bacterium]|nr:hypothetical protein [Gammaproteobacteria bacterium]